MRYEVKASNRQIRINFSDNKKNWYAKYTKRDFKNSLKFENVKVENDLLKSTFETSCKLINTWIDQFCSNIPGAR